MALGGTGKIQKDEEEKTEKETMCVKRIVTKLQGVSGVSSGACAMQNR